MYYKYYWYRPQARDLSSLIFPKGRFLDVIYTYRFAAVSATGEGVVYAPDGYLLILWKYIIGADR